MIDAVSLADGLEGSMGLKCSMAVVVVAVVVDSPKPRFLVATNCSGWMDDVLERSSMLLSSNSMESKSVFIASSRL